MSDPMMFSFSILSFSATPSRKPTTLSLAATVLSTGIRLYRRVFAGRPTPCRFDPTCSQYGLDAIQNFGALRGSWLTAKRISRCRPGGGAGYDPVPRRQETNV
jgi:uncharacterized protein